MWDALDFEILVCGAATVCCKVVLNVCPAFIHNVGSKFLQILIEAQADDSNSVAPSFFVVWKHFLVVGHGRLARRTPRCPEVVQNNLPLLMFNVGFTIFKDEADAFNNSNVISDLFAHYLVNF